MMSMTYARRRRHLHPFGQRRAGRDDRLRADVRSVQQDRAHADQALILDRAAVDDRRVANRDVVADRRLVRPLHDVHDAAVLYVRAAADTDPVHVAADHHTHPDAALFADLDVADHLGAVVDVGGRVDARQHAAVRAEHYVNYSRRWTGGPARGANWVVA